MKHPSSPQRQQCADRAGRWRSKEAPRAEGGWNRSKRLTAAIRAANSPAVGLFFVREVRRTDCTVTGRVVDVRLVRPPASTSGTVAVARQRRGAKITRHSTRLRTMVSTACRSDESDAHHRTRRQSRGQRQPKGEPCCYSSFCFRFSWAPLPRSGWVQDRVGSLRWRRGL